MAADIFLKIEGLDGESIVEAHVDEIDCDSFSWGASNASSMQRGGGGGVGKGDCHPLNISGMIDKASPEFWKKCMKGEHFESALLTARKAGGGEPVQYVKMDMKKVYIANWVIQGSSNTGMQNLSITFEEVTFTYTGQNDDGSEKEPVEVHYNIGAMTD
jgi:type VI secretion system secreted protein Hcp